MEEAAAHLLAHTFVRGIFRLLLLVGAFDLDEVALHVVVVSATSSMPRCHLAAYSWLAEACHWRCEKDSGANHAAAAALTHRPLVCHAVVTSLSCKTPLLPDGDHRLSTCQLGTTCIDCRTRTRSSRRIRCLSRPFGRGSHRLAGNEHPQSTAGRRKCLNLFVHWLK